MLRVLVAFFAAALWMTAGAIAAGGNRTTSFTRFDFYLLPSWCENVVIKRNRTEVSRLKLGEVYSSDLPGTAEFGFDCGALGFGGVSFKCEEASLLLLIFGLNIEGNKEKKLSVLCLK